MAAIASNYLIHGPEDVILALRALGDGFQEGYPGEVFDDPTLFPDIDNLIDNFASAHWADLSLIEPNSAQDYVFTSFDLRRGGDIHNRYMHGINPDWKGDNVVSPQKGVATFHSAVSQGVKDSSFDGSAWLGFKFRYTPSEGWDRQQIRLGINSTHKETIMELEQAAIRLFPIDQYDRISESKPNHDGTRAQYSFSLVEPTDTSKSSTREKAKLLYNTAIAFINNVSDVELVPLDLSPKKSLYELVQ